VFWRNNTIYFEKWRNLGERVPLEIHFAPSRSLGFGRTVVRCPKLVFMRAYLFTLHGGEGKCCNVTHRRCFVWLRFVLRRCVLCRFMLCCLVLRRFVLCRFLLYHFILCRFVLRRFVMCIFMLRRFVLCCFMLSRFMLRRFVLCRFMLCCFLLCRFMLSRFMLRRFVLCRFMLRRFLLCRFMLCYVASLCVADRCRSSCVLRGAVRMQCWLL